MTDVNVEQLAERVRQRDRAALARAITLVESLAPRDIEPAGRLMELLHAPDRAPALRVGISGIPGAGKSTFAEALGMHVVESGQRVAVLAVDPSSSRSGGSILGDKTRMERLSRRDEAFIRPTAGGGQAGGIAPRTREAMLVCEAAGFDVVLVETIGVGQSETAVRDVVDAFVLLAITGAGDDLQGIKRGVLELADFILVNKADGDNTMRAEQTAAELRSALQILHGARPDAIPHVATCSAREGHGIDAAWSAIRERISTWRDDGSLATRRRDQDLAWFDRKVDEFLRVRFLHERTDAIRAAREDVARGALPPAAAQRVVTR